MAGYTISYNCPLGNFNNDIFASFALAFVSSAICTVAGPIFSLEAKLSKSGFIFINRDGNVHNPHAINRAIERIRISCNAEEAERAKAEKREAIQIPHFSVHNLRHTFCTRFCENETNIKVIQEIMGHSDISTTMNIYAEATEAKKKDTINCLDNNYRILPLKVV